MIEVPSYWQESVPASKLSTMRCGGDVRFFAQPRTMAELEETYTYILRHSLPVTILGGGSNRIFPDTLFDGVVVQPLFTHIEPREAVEGAMRGVVVEGRYRSEGEGFLSLIHTTAEISSQEERYVEMGAGVPWGQAVAWTFNHSLAGFEQYARIPCRVGGAVYNNIHAGKHLLSEQVAGVWVFDPNTASKVWYAAKDLEFGYDYSRFHHTNEVICAVVFHLHTVSEEVNAANRAQYQAWTAEKGSVQPAGPNSGSVFKNLSPEEAARYGETAVAAAWYVDQCGFKGREIGGMQVYPGHANFIVNTGSGTQADFIALVEEIRNAVFRRWGFWLHPEVQCLDLDGKDRLWQLPLNG